MDFESNAQDDESLRPIGFEGELIGVVARFKLPSQMKRMRQEPGIPTTRSMFRPSVYLKHQDLTGFMPYGTKIPPKKPGDDPGSRIGMHRANPGWVDWAAAWAQIGSDLLGLSFRFAG